MTFLTLSLLIGSSYLSTPKLPEQTTDSVKLNELTVFSFATNHLSLPYVSTDKKTIEMNDFVTPADALHNQTGLWVSRDGTWATSLNVRGMSEQRLLFLSDEDRIQSATDIAGVLSTVDMNSLEKIEVVKGASSVLYGTGAMGGIVNFISERPGYSNQFKTSGKVSSGYHTVNKLQTNAATVNFMDKIWYISVNGSYRTAENTNTPEGKLLNSQFNDASWGLKGGMKYGDKQELLVSYNHFQAWNVGIPGSNSFPATATARYSAIKRNQLNAEYIFTDISTLVKELRIKAYTQNISRDVELKPNAANLTLPASLNTTSGIKATSNLYFNNYNTVTLGVEGWLRDSETGRMKINMGADTTVIGEIPTPASQMMDVGVFALYKKVIDPRYLQLNAGFRLDYVRTENDTAFNRIFNYKIIDGVKVDVPFAKNILFYPGVNHNISYSAHVDMEYSPAKNQKIILSLANAYRVASIEERFKYIDLGNGIHKGNPNLKSEQGWFSNLRYTFAKKRMLIKADLFANYLFDLIAEERSTATSNVYEYKNIDQALFAGAEIEFNAVVTNRLRFSTNASYVYTRDVKADTSLPMIPPAHGMTSLSYMAGNVLETSLQMEWAATQHELAANETATQGYVIFNYRINSIPVYVKNIYLQAFAGVDNILDKAYKNHLFNNRGLNFYEPGRNVFIKLKLGW